MEAPITNLPKSNTDRIKEEISCMIFHNDDEEYSIKMRMFDNIIAFKVILRNTLNSWEANKDFEFFKSSKLFAFADSISDIYNVLVPHFKEKDLNLVKENGFLNLSFEFSFFKNKKFNYVIELIQNNQEITIDIINQMMLDIDPSSMTYTQSRYNIICFIDDELNF